MTGIGAHAIMNSHGAIQCPAVDDPLKEESDGAGEIAALRLELEKARCELDRRQERLAQMDGLFAHNVTLELRANSELEKALDDRKRAEALLEREKKLLEMIARGQSLAEIFEGLCRVVEEVSGDALAAIMVLDPDGRRLRNGSAPSFPEGFIAAVDGVEIGPAVGSCGTAAYRKEQVIVCDIATDPLWANYRELAFAYGLRAGWSTPILDSDGGVLGTFAIYWREPRSPDRQHFQIINQITHLAAVAIERKRAAEALVASERLARGQAEALTGALDRLTRESDPDRIVEHVLRTVTAQSGAHSSSVWLRDESTGLMAFEFALEDGKFKTKSDGALAAVSPKLPVEAVWPWPEVFRTRKPCLLEDIRTGPDFPWRVHVLAQGIVTILVVPMVIAGDVQGVVGIRFTHKRSFRVEEMELPQALANQAMLAVQLARLSAHSRQSAIIAERNRMARDVHDALAHGFTGVILHLEAAEEAMSRERAGVVSSHLRSAGEIARDGLREARRSVQALRPLALEEKSLGEAFKELVNKMTAIYGCPKLMARG